jgi:glycosyl transferase family 2
MLTQALFLSAGWLTLSFIATLLRGTKVKKGNWFYSILWLAVILLCGDVWALLTFGVFAEVAGLTILAFSFGLWWIWKLPNWNALGQTLWTTTLLTSALYVAYSFAVTAFTPLSPLAFVITLALTFVEMLALALALTYAYESLDVCCRIRWNRRFQPRLPIPGYTPKVSLHVPAYNEPPEVVAATLHSLMQLDYPNYEVLVIDNNTPEESTWRPLEKICEDLGPIFASSIWINGRAISPAR